MLFREERVPGRRRSDAIITRVGEDSSRGEVESHDDLFLGGAAPELRGSTFNPADFYTYVAEDTAGLVIRIERLAGPQY